VEQKEKKGRVVNLEGDRFAEVLFLRRGAAADAADELGVLDEGFDRVEGTFAAGAHLAEVVLVADVGGTSGAYGGEGPGGGDADVLAVTIICQCDHGLYIGGVVFKDRSAWVTRRAASSWTFRVPCPRG
jgi:hypothetical protein